MRKLLILLAVIVFIVVYAVPAIARAPTTAIPAMSEIDQMISSVGAASRGTVVPITMATAINEIRAPALTVMAANHRTLLATIQIQVALDVNYHGRYICLTGVLANENTIPTLTNDSMIQARNNAVYSCTAPVAHKANECTFGQEIQEQRAAMHYNLTNACIVIAIRMDNTSNTDDAGTILRL